MFNTNDNMLESPWKHMYENIVYITQCIIIMKIFITFNVLKKEYDKYNDNILL